jgi:hypothetical protein
VSSSRNVFIDLRYTDRLVDTYLYLFSGINASGTPLAFNDDYGGTLNSSISGELGAGSYTIAAATYAKNQTGAYTCASAGIDDVRDGDSRGHAAWLITRDGGTMLPEHRGI